MGIPEKHSPNEKDAHGEALMFLTSYFQTTTQNFSLDPIVQVSDISWMNQRIIDREKWKHDYIFVKNKKNNFFFALTIWNLKEFIWEFVMGYNNINDRQISCNN